MQAWWKYCSSLITYFSIAAVPELLWLVFFDWVGTCWFIWSTNQVNIIPSILSVSQSSNHLWRKKYTKLIQCLSPMVNLRYWAYRELELCGNIHFFIFEDFCLGDLSEWALLVWHQMITALYSTYCRYRVHLWYFIEIGRIVDCGVL